MRASLLLCAIAAPVAADAQVRDSTYRDSTARARAARLPAVQVIGSVLDALAPGVGAAAPARAAVLDAATLRARQPRHLAEALTVQPGITLYDDLGSPWKATLVTRGFAASPVVGLPQGLSVFVDGVPVNEPDAGQVNFDLLPLRHVRAVEVLRGTASLLGPNSLGGAVNLVTHRGTGAPSGTLAVSGGAWGRGALEGSAGGTVRGWSVEVGGGAERERGWRQLTAARRADGFASVARLGDRRGVALQAFAARSRAETAGSLPLSVYAVRADSNLSAGDFEDLDQLHAALTGYASLGRGRGTFTLYARRHTAERFNVNQVDDPDVRGFSHNRTLGASVDWRAARALGAGTLGVRVGAGGQANRTAIRLFAERIEPGLTTDVASPIGKLDAFALADYRLGRLVVSAGARQDVVRVPFRNRLRPARDTTSTFRRLSPRAGVRLTVADGMSLHGSVGRSFRAPAVIELACADPEEPCPLPFALGDDPPLAPVVATTAEVGGDWARGPLRLDVSAFHTRLRDEIFLFPYSEEGAPEASTIDGFFANVPRTRRAGLEADAWLALPGGHALRAGYAYTRATFESEAEIFSVREAAGEENEVVPGSRLPLVPANAATAAVELRPGGGWSVDAVARYTGARWLRGDEANVTEPLPGFWVAELHVGYARGGWGVDATLQNVLDRRYATFGTFNLNHGADGRIERFLTPGAPRALQVRLRRSVGARR